MNNLLHRVKTDPLESFQNPEMKAKLTPSLLSCMSLVGISYAVVVTSMIFLSVVFWVLPVVSPESYEFWTRACIVTFFFTNVVVNFILVSIKRGFYDKNSELAGLPNASWNKCLDCDQNTPPRAHHCPLCQKCVLKRDHHCFFTGSCVGYENQRYYLVFCFYCGIGSAYCFYIVQQFIALTYLREGGMNVVHFILPVAAVECIFGYMTFGLFYCIFLAYLCALSAVGSLGIFSWQFFLASHGTTTYEYGNNARFYKKDLFHNLRDVFGPWWLLNFIVPMICIQTPGNGVEWHVTKNL